MKFHQALLLVAPMFASVALSSPSSIIYRQHSEQPTPIELQKKLTALIGEAEKTDYRWLNENNFGGGAVYLTRIVNLGRKVWDIVKAGKPVVNITYDYANALPAGVKSDELAGFSPLQFRSFRESGVNPFGVTVYDVEYTAVHRYGGSYNGKGRYLESVAIVPTRVSVAWLYDVGFSVTQVGTANVGSKDMPVAGMTVESVFRVSTAVKEYQSRHIFDFQGDKAQVNETFSYD